jgi:hypothetical protein
LTSWAKWAKRAKVGWALCKGFVWGTKECWVENREKNRNLDYNFRVADLDFENDVTEDVS